MVIGGGGSQKPGVVGPHPAHPPGWQTLVIPGVLLEAYEKSRSNFQDLVNKYDNYLVQPKSKQTSDIEHLNDACVANAREHLTKSVSKFMTVEAVTRATGDLTSGTKIIRSRLWNFNKYYGKKTGSR